MKKTLYVVSLLCAVFFIGKVQAKEVYYTNNKGVNFSHEEYDFLSKMFWEGSQDLMTPIDYEKFIDSKIMEGDFQYKSIDEEDELGIVPYGTYYETSGKRLSIATSCVNDCFVSVTLKWKYTPNVKSWDVMGAYLINTSLVNVPSTTAESTTYTHMTADVQYFSNGFGVSIDMSNLGDSVLVNQNYRLQKSGHVYASYQHATKSISYENSKSYTLSRAGDGGVFYFSGGAFNVYDGMGGVDMALS